MSFGFVVTFMLPDLIGNNSRANTADLAANSLMTESIVANRQQSYDGNFVPKQLTFVPLWV